MGSLHLVLNSELENGRIKHSSNCWCIKSKGVKFDFGPGQLYEWLELSEIVKKVK